MNVRGIQRNMKNVVKNYSDAQVKVREATSNDPWGPSSTLMSEIADLTYNVVAFSEIMQMIWKRLNDHGKNWRHVYKALMLLEYLIKTGSEKVAQQCKENIFAIQTLKDFQYIEENKDQGMNVREKSKGLVGLLKDDEKLKNERARALKAKERFAQSVSYASDPNSMETIPKTSVSYHESLSSGLSPGVEPLASDLESARPQTLGEEELQLQLALAMSKEEAEQEDRQRKNDDLRLHLAINESHKVVTPRAPEKKSAIDDLLSLNTSSLGATAASDPWGNPHRQNGASGGIHTPMDHGLDAFGAVGGASPPAVSVSDPWNPSPVNMTPVNDPWSNTQPQTVRSGSASNDPWQASPPTNNTPNMDPWSSCDNRPTTSPSIDGLLGGSHGNGLTASSNAMSAEQYQIRKTPESFLGANSNLVNLDALVSTKATSSLPIGGNPFAGVTAASAASAAAAANPFQAAKPPPPTINQLRSQTSFPVGGGGMGAMANHGLINLNQQQSVGAAQPLTTNSTASMSANFSTPGNNPFAM